MAGRFFTAPTVVAAAMLARAMSAATGRVRFAAQALMMILILVGGIRTASIDRGQFPRFSAPHASRGCHGVSSMSGSSGIRGRIIEPGAHADGRRPICLPFSAMGSKAPVRAYSSSRRSDWPDTTPAPTFMSSIHSLWAIRCWRNLPAKSPWRIGHFDRDLPDGYREIAERWRQPPNGPRSGPLYHRCGWSPRTVSLRRSVGGPLQRSTSKRKRTHRQKPIRCHAKACSDSGGTDAAAVLRLNRTSRRLPLPRRSLRAGG